MTPSETRHSGSQGSLHLDESLPLPGGATGIGAFELDFASGQWAWTPHVALLFGTDPHALPTTFEDSLRTVFADDAPKILGALEAAKASGNYYVEFRVKRPDGRLHWLAGKSQSETHDGAGAQVLRGTYYEIGERKQLEAKLLGGQRNP
jgi:PAS fold